jgi:chromosome segregation ATPase
MTKTQRQLAAALQERQQAHDAAGSLQQQMAEQQHQHQQTSSELRAHLQDSQTVAALSRRTAQQLLQTLAEMRATAEANAQQQQQTTQQLAASQQECRQASEAAAAAQQQAAASDAAAAAAQQQLTDVQAQLDASNARNQRLELAGRGLRDQLAVKDVQISRLNAEVALYKVSML